MPETHTFRFNPSYPRRLTRVLNAHAVAGRRCVSLSHRIGKTTLTLEPTAPNAPLYLWLAVPWEAFYQPVGWDFALHDDRFALFTRPLPPGTVALKPMTSFWVGSRGHLEEKRRWLSEQARAGKQLVAVWQGMYYFAPAEPTEVDYRIKIAHLYAENEAITDTNAVCPDGDGYYFISHAGSTDIFADRPGLAPTDVTRAVPFDLWRASAETAKNHRRHSLRSEVAGSVALCGLTLLAACFLETVFPGMVRVMLMTVMLNLGWSFLGFWEMRDYNKSEAGQLLDICRSPADYPHRMPFCVVPRWVAFNDEYRQHPFHTMKLHPLKLTAVCLAVMILAFFLDH